MTPADRHHRFGFTLIELLGTVAIIALLASLLLPALSRAKSEARRAQCLNNVRQISLAALSYVGDFSAYPPFGDTVNPDSPFWPDKLLPYLNAPWTAPIYQCPGFAWKNRASLWTVGQGGKRSAVQGGQGCYDMNATYLSQPGGPPLGIGGTYATVSGTIQFAAATREASVLITADMIAFGDVCLDPKYLVTADSYLNILGTKLWAMSGVAANMKLAEQRFRARHNGIMNIGFCDGHVESAKRDRFLAFRPEVLRRWFRDNEPHPETWR
jgi:prepilin-type processing-associated H-X9-DG protein/prepilin-type N-terminal cleavage/methylation domain-containing protein